MRRAGTRAVYPAALPCTGCAGPAALPFSGRYFRRVPPAAGSRVRRVAIGAALAAWASVLAWACVVFWLGGDDFGHQSTSRIMVPLIRFFWPDASYADIRAVSSTLRSLAHPVEYAILALLSLRAARLSGISMPLRMAAVAVGVAACVSLLDEVRQSRLATRVGSAADVALDLSGAGVAVAGLLWLRRRREVTEDTGG